MRETTWRLRGLDFGALEQGAGPGVPTVLVHGFLDHAGSWERAAAHLPGPVVAVDLRGHGRSDWVGPGQTYHFPEYLADLDALVQALGGRVRLVGHSLGGNLVSVYAGARPAAVERLVVVDGLGLPDQGEQYADRVVAFLDGLAREHHSRVHPSIEAAAAQLVAVYPRLDPGWAVRLAERGTRRVPGGYAWAYDPRHRLRAPQPYRQDQHLQLLGRIRCPVLAVHPEVPTFPAPDVARMEAAVADLRAVPVAGAGHMIHLEAPDDLGRLIADFLGTGPSAPP